MKARCVATDPFFRWQDGGSPTDGGKQTLRALERDAYGAELGVDKKGAPKNVVSTNLLMWLQNYEQGRGLACKIKAGGQQKKVLIGVPPTGA